MTHDGVGPRPQGSFDPLATSANWWDLPPLAPEDYEPPAPTVSDEPPIQFSSAPGPYRLGAPVARVGFSEALVASAPRRTEEHNDLGRFSLLIGIGLFFLLALSFFVGAMGWSVILLIFAGIGARFGFRGLSAERRGLATNRGSSIAGIVLAGLFVVTFFVTYLLSTMAVLRDAAL